MPVNFAYEASLPNQTIDACLCCGYTDCQCDPCPACEGECEIISANGTAVECPACEGLGVTDRPQPIVDALDNPCAVEGL